MTAVRSVLVMTNPHSGAGLGSRTAVAVWERFEARGVTVTEICGTSARETERLVRAAVTGDDRPDAVVVVGGDGLMNLALDALAATGVPLGLVPSGTGNDLARYFDIPLTDPAAAADVVLDGEIRTIDLGVVERGGIGRRFATVAATGLDARVTLRANRMTFPRGSLRYTVAAAFELLGRMVLPYRLEYADGSVHEIEAVMVAVGNTSTYGGGMPICPDAVPDDGLLDVTVVGRISRATMAMLLPRLASGHFTDHPAVSRHQVTGLTLIADAPVTADGEDFGALPVTIRVLPGAQRICVPAAASGPVASR